MAGWLWYFEKRSGSSKNRSIVTQNGPATLERTRGQTSLSLGTGSFLLDFGAEVDPGGADEFQGIVHLHHVVQPELVDLPPRDIGGRERKAVAGHLDAFEQRQVEEVRVARLRHLGGEVLRLRRDHAHHPDFTGRRRSFWDGRAGDR